MEQLRQRDHAVRFEWGPTGAQALAGLGDVVVVVDILSFSTTVSVAMDRGMRIQPWADDAPAPAAHLPIAVRREAVSDEQPWSLSPVHLQTARFTPTLVLPSPNGGGIAATASRVSAVVLAGGIRNARATAVVARRSARGLDPAGQRRRGANGIVVIAAGERWPDDSLRPAIEDLLGAGAIIAALVQHCGVPLEACSPEAQVALRAWRDCPDLDAALHGCASGRELEARGFVGDVDLAAELDASPLAALLTDGAFTPVQP